MSIKIILVQPEIPENVGFVVRSMLCYGASELAIVGRRRYTLKSKAYKTGYAASEILEQAKWFYTLGDAIADCEITVGFSRRWRTSTALRFLGLDESVPTWNVHSKMGLVFGRESQGLSAEEMRLLDQMVYIPLEHKNMSLNLSHAVTVVLHQIYTQSPKSNHPLRMSRHLKGSNQEQRGPIPSDGAKPRDDAMEKAVSYEDREKYFSKLMCVLDTKKQFEGNKGEARRRYARQLWQKLAPTRGELDFLYGLFSDLS